MTSLERQVIADLAKKAMDVKSILESARLNPSEKVFITCTDEITNKLQKNWDAISKANDLLNDIQSYLLCLHKSTIEK